MRLVKKLTASAAALAIAAAMSVSAFAAAATKDTLVQTAKDCGVQDHNVQQLKNFLEKYGDDFTGEQYDDMCKAIEKTYNDIVLKYLPEGKTASELTNTERTALFKGMKEEDQQAVIKNLKDTGAKFGVTLTVDKRTDGNGYDVTWEYKKETSPVDSDKPADTGDAANVNNAAAFIAAAAMLLAGTGIVVVAKKNKEN